MDSGTSRPSLGHKVLPSFPSFSRQHRSSRELWDFVRGVQGVVNGVFPTAFFQRDALRGWRGSMRAEGTCQCQGLQHSDLPLTGSVSVAIGGWESEKQRSSDSHPPLESDTTPVRG